MKFNSDILLSRNNKPEKPEKPVTTSTESVPDGDPGTTPPKP